MPTDEWFKENPKVSAYIPQDLNEKLAEWMKGRNIKKVSQALTAILEEYLGVVQTEPIIQPVRDDRLEALEQKLESLSQIVQELREPIQVSSPKVIQTELFPVEPIEEILSDDEAIALINAKQPIDVLEEEIGDDAPDEILLEKSSLKVEESSPIVESQKTQPPNIMNSYEVAELVGSTYNAVGKHHRAGKVLEEKGYKCSPEKQGHKQVWVVEPI